MAQESAATLTDSILGSPNYMAPEQADGRGKYVTVETDVYGLGVVLYEALTNVPPFQAGLRSRRFARSWMRRPFHRAN